MNTDLVSYSQAISMDCWVDAIWNELQALHDNNTWTITSLWPNHKAIGCKWVFKIKYNSDGTVDKHKAHLVAKCFNQKEGIDYTETFAPVSKMTTLRTFLANVVSKNWFLHQMDVHNAFLHGNLEETVFMQIPQGLELPSNAPPHPVYLLWKFIYGLK